MFLILPVQSILALYFLVLGYLGVCTVSETNHYTEEHCNVFGSGYWSLMKKAFSLWMEVVADGSI